ncbi:hypothetical protein V8G54_012831 [Vigna mungo]|uniref:Uncharacterized protein n=1 Tax=Vigna mungo TaxID=3915 RepID=A0AAQ3NTY4_VIGMU
MSKLQWLDLSDNSLALEFTKNWTPSFQLGYIGVRSSKLGPTFPKWFHTQNDIEILDISNCGISDSIPEWFWSKVVIQGMTKMNVSFNKLKGTIPKFPLEVTPQFVVLASNQFEGRVPSFLRGSAFLDLSQNKFSDFSSFLRANGTVEALGQLDLSNNQLSEQIPDCWNHLKSLAYLDLSHNNFSGMIPTSMGSLVELQALLLRNNSLTKEIPFSLRNCIKLVMFDLGDNRLSGSIPSWIGEIYQDLQILSLRKNNFCGSLPVQLCYLQDIQLLDLSLNSLSGRIPKCLKNFTSMTQKTSLTDYTHQGNSVSIRSIGQYMKYYDLYSLLTWKGADHIFLNNDLLLLKSIDLSSNQLSEEIPTEIEDLFELILNLSRNNLTGKIPSNIGRLTSLEFLDLSRNQILGSIPTSLTQMDRLTMLDLSHNNLSGQIPIGTQLQSFEASSYEYNSNLCGKPLDKLCGAEEPPHEANVDESKEDENFVVNGAFYVSMILGFITGLCITCGSNLFNCPWRQLYFRFLNNLTDNIYRIITAKVPNYKR